MTDTRLEPLRVGTVLFPSFTALDVFGPLNALNSLALRHNMTHYVLSHNLDPVSVDRNIVDGVSWGNAGSSSSPFFTEWVLPTHTFDDPPELDVILVPGGGGTRNLTSTQPAVDYIARVLQGSEADDWPEYVLTVCTGAALAARSGRIAGKNATTNKLAFNWVKSQEGAEKVNWIAKARWVVDGKLWTSSGVSAGTDMTLGWIEHLHGRNESERVRIGMEWNALNQTDDPFAGIIDQRARIFGDDETVWY
jgi:putative intracellular protease/amidase